MKRIIVLANPVLAKLVLTSPVLAAILCLPAPAADQPGTTFKIFQFPPDRIPRVDGNPDDWKMVPDDYAIGMDQLVDDTHKDRKPDPKDLDVKVKVGWVKGLNRLYFLYEAYDNYWDFARPGLHNDIFEVVVDGDLSGGPLIERFQPTKELSERDAHFSMHGVHAQNYHIMTPPSGKDWALAWGCNAYVKNLPYANAAYNYNFKPGESGKLILEFWITPFDYAGCEGPQRAVESVLHENKLIGLAWAVLDYDDAASESHAFWNLSRQHTMYGKADELVAFRLMPLEPQYRKFEANWSFVVTDMDRRMVAFEDESTRKDESTGPNQPGNTHANTRITSWKWTFGDGATSTEQNPLHQYARGGDYTVVLEVEGPEGTSRREKIWDVAVR
ncbi:MAG TPA: PKD domain-containing protein [Candidatus Acidoferrales bacterium]|nr:PKD domain-containing protein [Candidatus Acidoferrales bacterium]